MSNAGKLNRYTCKDCGHVTITIDRVDGVTPFMTGCTADGCNGMALSSFYQIEPDDEPTHEWYRPTPEAAAIREVEFPGTADHVRRGGLVRRPIASFVVEDVR